MLGGARALLRDAVLFSFRNSILARPADFGSNILLECFRRGCLGAAENNLCRSECLDATCYTPNGFLLPRFLHVALQYFACFFSFLAGKGFPFEPEGTLRAQTPSTYQPPPRALCQVLDLPLNSIVWTSAFAGVFRVAAALLGCCWVVVKGSRFPHPSRCSLCPGDLPASSTSCAALWLPLRWSVGPCGFRR